MRRTVDGFLIVEFQPTRPLRGATIGLKMAVLLFSVYFNPRAPCGARPNKTVWNKEIIHFNPRAPCGARP